MGMPVTVDIVGTAPTSQFDEIFEYFAAVDRKFSLYKPDSEICALNRNLASVSTCSAEMKEVIEIAERTRHASAGYFDIRRSDGTIDPSGIVKGWAIRNAAELVRKAGFENFFIDAGGDIQSCGVNEAGQSWKVGIRNPFNEREIIKVVTPNGRGVATSGTYVRGQHIYDPHQPGRPIQDIVSLSVIGPDVLEADRFATAAFAMGAAGIHFIESHPGLEGYVVDANGIATQTSGLGAYVTP